MSYFDWNENEPLKTGGDGENPAEPAAENDSAADFAQAGAAADEAVNVSAEAEGPAAEAQESVYGYESPLFAQTRAAAEQASAGEDAAEADFGERRETQAPRFTPGPARQGEYEAYRPFPSYRTGEAEEKEKSSHGFFKRAIALVLCCVLLAAAAGFGGGYLAARSGKNQTPAPGGSSASMLVSSRETTPITVVRTDAAKELTAAEVYAQNVNSTVGITTEIITTNWWGYQSTAAAAGSGFILTDNGYILTNYHVIENANTITVAMYDGKTYSAELIGFDASNDIAVLKIDAEALTPVVLGNSDDLVVGQDVLAIGNPLGELTFSLTRGAVSALDRKVSLSNSVTMELIQTDCAINSGNSGGALFNLYGEVVGITNAKYSSNSSSQASIDNIGFAIPINTVRGIVTSIIEKGYITKPYIGVSVDNVGSESQSYGMPQGAAIRRVEQDSPAERGGLQANDIVTAVNGKTVSGFTDLSGIVSESQPGDVLELTVYRKGETLTLKVTVGEKIQSATGKTNQSSQSGENGQSGQSGEGFPYPGFPFGG